MNAEPKRNEDIALSIVIPVRDEEKNLAPLYRGIIETLTGKYKDFEIIFIDDGSVDGDMQNDPADIPTFVDIILKG